MRRLFCIYATGEQDDSFCQSDQRINTNLQIPFVTIYSSLNVRYFKRFSSIPAEMNRKTADQNALHLERSVKMSADDLNCFVLLFFIIITIFPENRF